MSKIRKLRDDVVDGVNTAAVVVGAWWRAYRDARVDRLMRPLAERIEVRPYPSLKKARHVVVARDEAADLRFALANAPDARARHRLLNEAADRLTKKTGT